MKVFLLMCSMFLLSACLATADDVRVQTDNVDVRVKSDPSHPHDGKFCPPGQAKKGNC